jgi:nitrite reductase/ring-hydroxylating ferredoxin subunit
MGDYLRNCWYMLGWSHEVEGAMLARTVLGLNVVAFRNEQGDVGTILDRCPHRYAPLSMGHVQDGLIHCGYHGLVFSETGACVRGRFGMPPRDARVKGFPTQERDHIIWIWPGDPNLVDISMIPDFSFHNRNEAAEDWVLFDYTYVKTHYEVETDNLMDLSHIETLHAQSFGGRGYIDNGTFEVIDKSKEIHANWWIPEVVLHDVLTGLPTEERADHFLDMEWNAPSAMCLNVAFLPVDRYRDRASGLRRDLPGQLSAHILTPETECTTHYFWSAASPTDLYGALDKEADRTMLRGAFDKEDKVMLEAVQRNMDGDFWSGKPLILPYDAGGIRARRRLAKMISDERKADVASAAGPIPLG